MDSSTSTGSFIVLASCYLLPSPFSFSSSSSSSSSSSFPLYLFLFHFTHCNSHLHLTFISRHSNHYSLITGHELGVIDLEHDTPVVATAYDGTDPNKAFFVSTGQDGSVHVTCIEVKRKNMFVRGFESDLSSDVVTGDGTTVVASVCKKFYIPQNEDDSGYAYGKSKNHDLMIIVFLYHTFTLFPFYPTTGTSVLINNKGGGPGLKGRGIYVGDSRGHFTLVFGKYRCVLKLLVLGSWFLVLGSNISILLFVYDIFKLRFSASAPRPRWLLSGVFRALEGWSIYF